MKTITLVALSGTVGMIIGLSLALRQVRMTLQKIRQKVEGR